MTTYKHCFDCQRPLRPIGSKASDHPETVANGGRGLCRRDYDVRAKAGTLDQVTAQILNRPTACRGCDIPLRGTKDRATDHPGTRAHRRDGYCWKCLNNDVEQVALGVTEEAARIEAMRRDVTRWIRGWRRRNNLPLDAPIDGMEVAA